MQSPERAPEDDLVPSSGARSPSNAYQQALGLLARREHSWSELERKLMGRGHDVGTIHAALDRLVGAGYQDDRRFAQGIVRQRVGSGYGPRYLAAQLRTLGVDPEVSAEALESAGSDWCEVAVALLQRRFPKGISGLSDRRRAITLLQRRGFTGDCIARALSRSGDAVED